MKAEIPKGDSEIRLRPTTYSDRGRVLPTTVYKISKYTINSIIEVGIGRDINLVIGSVDGDKERQEYGGIHFLNPKKNSS